MDVETIEKSLFIHIKRLQRGVQIKLLPQRLMYRPTYKNFKVKANNRITEFTKNVQDES